MAVVPKIYNQRNWRYISDAVRKVDRSTKYGNPFAIGEHGSRKQVIKKFIKYWFRTPSLIENAFAELYKDKWGMVCWCVDLNPNIEQYRFRCHAEVIHYTLYVIGKGGVKPIHLHYIANQLKTWR